MEAFGGVLVVIILGICAFSLIMRAAGKGDVPDKMATGMTSWWLDKLK